MSGREHLTYGEHEYDATLDYIVTPGGLKGWCLRVTWRRQGARRWESFLLCPNDGQTFADLAGNVGPAIEAKAGWVMSG